MFLARRWLGGVRSVCLVVLVAAACDRPVPDTGPIPAGQVEKVARALAPPNNFGDTNVVDFCDPSCVCPASVDPCVSYVCNCSGGCDTVYTTAACDDGNACTANDRCDGAGSCRPGGSYACAGDQCNSSRCDGRGGCINTPLNGNPCNDGNACTYGDTCNASGTCGGTAITCTSDACNSRTCQGSSACLVTPRTGSGCDDNNPCTYGDTCNAQGACTSGTLITCTSDVCNTRSCNGTSTCTVVPQPGRACNDGNACTYGETCNMQGSCDGGNSVTCANDSCNIRSCNGTASCVVTPRAGNPCDDGQACTYGDVCSAGGACSGTTITCTSDANADRSCNGSSTCTVVPRPGAACDDGDDCTRGDVRQSDGSCKGMPYSCAVGDCLMSSRCDGRGGCQQVAKPDGTECDADKNLCTPKDVCKGGACVPDPTPVKCVERDCNTVACNPSTGNCDYTATSGGSCGVSGCFSAGVCNAGQCSGTPKDCSNYNGSCTTGLCDAATGACVAAPKLNGTDCSAGGRCTAAAACAFGVCELTSMTCPAASAPCKVAACDPLDGKCAETMRPPGAPCDPKNSCITDGMCDQAGNCRGAPALNGSPCTLPGGKVGECVVGTCVASSGGGTQDAGSDGPGSGGTQDASGDTKVNGAARRGCSMGGAGNAGAGWALLLGALAVLSRSLRRRPEGEQPQGPSPPR
jgi:hypothetical protein